MKRSNVKSLKSKVIANVRDLEEDRQKTSSEHLQDYFANKYEKLKSWTPPKRVNMEKFFSIPRSLFLQNEFSLGELSIYPVICGEQNHKDQAFTQIPLEIISSKSGVSIPTVLKAIELLDNKEVVIYNKIDTETRVLLLRQKHTEGQRTFWLYLSWFLRQDEIDKYKGEQFFFYTSLIESGIWSKLNPRAKALYLIMRSVSEFDFQEYCNAEDIAYHEFNAEEIYRRRKWEVCRIPISTLCKRLNISRSRINMAVAELERYGLVVKTPYAYIVFQSSKRFDYGEQGAFF